MFNYKLNFFYIFIPVFLFCFSLFCFFQTNTHSQTLPNCTGNKVLSITIDGLVCIDIVMDREPLTTESCPRDQLLIGIDGDVIDCKTLISTEAERGCSTIGEIQYFDSADGYFKCTPFPNPPPTDTLPACTNNQYLVYTEDQATGNIELTCTQVGKSIDVVLNEKIPQCSAGEVLTKKSDSVECVSTSGISALPICDVYSDTNFVDRGTFSVSNQSSLVTTTIGGIPYALVALQSENEVKIINISNPSSPTETGSITDTDDLALGGAREITPIIIGGIHYAIVASFGTYNPITRTYVGSGVQILDLSNPRSPQPVGSIKEADDPNNLVLGGAYGITTITKGNKHYALVTAATDDGVQILDITDPTSPTPVKAIKNGEDGFVGLNGAREIVTTTIGTTQYAIVSSLAFHGIQIINISDPTNPVATEVVKLNEELKNFRRAYGIAIETIGSSHYAFVTSNRGNGVQVIDITNPETPVVASFITDGSVFPKLHAAREITTINIDGTLYAFVTSRVDSGVQVIDLSDPSALAPTSLLVNGESVNGYINLNGAYGINTTNINGSDYLLVIYADGIKFFEIVEKESPFLQWDGDRLICSAIEEEEAEPVPDPPTENCDGRHEVIQFDEAGGFECVETNLLKTALGKIYALVTSSAEDELKIRELEVEETGIKPIAAGSITDTDDLALENAKAITTTIIGGTIYALVAAATDEEDSGVQILDLTDPTSPTAAGKIVDTADDPDNLVLRGAQGITTTTIGTKQYALVASWGTYDYSIFNYVNPGVQIIDISNPTSPTAAGKIVDVDDSDNLVLYGARGITTTTIGTTQYALVAFYEGVQIIDISNPNSPTAAGSIVDTADLALDDGRGITTTTIGITQYALVASREGVQIINISNPTSPTAAGSIVDNNSLALANANTITTTTIGITQYALVASSEGVQIINISNPTSPTAAGSIVDNNSLALANANTITTTTIGTTQYALVTSSEGVQILDLTDPNSPSGVGSIVDTNNLVLDGATGITTTTIGVTQYALVASEVDNGVQIIDISKPEIQLNEVSKEEISDGPTFPELGLPLDVTHLTIDGIIYALVASFDDNGVQIVDLSDLSDPQPAEAVTDGVDGFDELLGASGITTTKINNTPYALVAAATDNGVQVVDLTDPTSPQPAESITDGVGGFDELEGATAITTITIKGTSYALVASKDDDGVQALRLDKNQDKSLTLTPAGSIDESYDVDGDGTSDPDDLALDGVSGITTITIKDKHYALVASKDDNGVQIIEIPSYEISPQPAGKIIDTADLALSIPYGITTTTIDENPYAIVSSSGNHGVQIINLSNPNSPTAAGSIKEADDPNNLVLESARGITTTTIGTKQYALVASLNESGVQIIDISNPNSPVAAGKIVDTDDLVLGFPERITTTTIGTTQYALVASYVDNGVQIINLSNPNSPTAAGNIKEVDDSNNLVLEGAYGITTTTIGTKQYALVASQGDNGVQIIDISNPNSPTAAGKIVDTDDLVLGFPEEITTTTIRGRTYALVASNEGFQIIDISNPNSPTAAGKIVDDYLVLEGAYGITTTTIGTKQYALITSWQGNGVQIIDISNPNSPTAAGSIVHTAGLELRDAWDITTTTIDGNPYALVISRAYSGVQVLELPSPQNSPQPVSAITDGVDGFDELEGATAITTITIKGTPYALVASEGTKDLITREFVGSGVQVIDLTDPTSPQPAASITDGVGGFDELAGATGITTTTIKNDDGTKLHFAFVSSKDDNKVQVIRLQKNGNNLELTPAGVLDDFRGPAGITILDKDILVDISQYQ